MQKTHWRRRTSCWKFWWLDNGRSQGPQWQLQISKQSPICSRGAGLGHSMDPSISVQKLHRKLKEACKSFLEPDRKPKVIYTDNSLEFGKACEDLSWNHCTSTSHKSQTNGVADRAVRWVKEGTSGVLLQSGIKILWNVTPICEQIYYLMERRTMKDVLGNHLMDPLFHLVHWLSITL